MPTITIAGKSQEFAEDTRLVLAIKQMGVNIGHRCGGKARCTTCRVDISHGEPKAMTQAEHEKLESQGLLGSVRLACQLTCSQDMTVSPLMTLESENWSDTGPEPSPDIDPEPTWVNES
jgi:ferredoxin